MTTGPVWLVSGLLALVLYFSIGLALPLASNALAPGSAPSVALTATPTAVDKFRVVPRRAEPNQPITIEIEGLPADVNAGRAEACLVLRDAQGQELDSWRLSPANEQTLEIKIRESVAPGNYHLTLEICALIGQNVVNAGPRLPPLAALSLTLEPRSGRFDQINTSLSPDGQWTAIVNTTAGSLTLADWRNNQTEILPEGSTVSEVLWSPDSRQLLAVRTNWLRIQGQTAISATGPLELWQLELDLQSRTVLTPTLLYKPAASDFTNGIAPPPQQIVLGSWSPNSRHVLFGMSLLSASVLADGIPPLVLDTATGQVYPVARPVLPRGRSPLELGRDNTALVNPAYHSWSPDGSKLAITAGGYRSAQVSKWLNIFDTKTGRTTTVISQTEQIPGIVAWSPRGDTLAYAAVEANLTGEEWADLMTFDNPAIAARRIYLLNPATGEHRRLNQVEAYQDSPVWNSTGESLYYVQRDGDQLKLMLADPATGQAQAVPGAVEPLDLQDPMRPNVGFYGQFEREGLLSFIPTDKVGALAAGWVISGAGRRGPVNNLPLWVGNEPVETITHRTDEHYGHFVLTGLQPGLIRVRNSHLEFEVPVAAITDTVDLGLLHYPLVHPPAYYGWLAAPLPDKSALLTQSEPISFTLCFTNTTWQRPNPAEQQAKVWSKRPFSNHAPDWLKWWFQQPAVLYDSQAIFPQSYPDGPSLDALTSEWRYLLGLWTDTEFAFAPDPESKLAIPHLVPQTGCAYDDKTLDDLLARRQLEVWLMGYRAVEVRRLDKSKAGYDKMTLCDLDDVTCTARPGYHFSLQVKPAAGYQIIRFPGVEDVLAINLLDDRGEEILDLPQVQPDRWN